MLRRLQDLHQKHRLDKKWPRRTAGRRTCLRPPRSLGARARLHQAAKQPARNVGLLHFYFFISTSSFLLLHFYFFISTSSFLLRLPGLSFRPTLVVVPTEGRNLVPSAPMAGRCRGGGRKRKQQSASGSAVARKILWRRQSRKKYVPPQTEPIRDHVNELD